MPATLGTPAAPMLETARLILRGWRPFEHFAPERIVSVIDPGNEASRKVAGRRDDWSRP